MRETSVEQKEAGKAITLRIVQQCLIPMATGPRATVAQWDHGTRRLTVWSATQKSSSGIETNGDLFASAECRAYLACVYTKLALAKVVERART